MNAKSIKLYLKFTRKEPPVGRLRGLGFIQLSPHGYKPGMVPDEIMGGIPFCLNLNFQSFYHSKSKHC